MITGVLPSFSPHVAFIFVPHYTSAFPLLFGFRHTPGLCSDAYLDLAYEHDVCSSSVTSFFRKLDFACVLFWVCGRAASMPKRTPSPARHPRHGQAIHRRHPSSTLSTRVSVGASAVLFFALFHELRNCRQQLTQHVRSSTSRLPGTTMHGYTWYQVPGTWYITWGSPPGLCLTSNGVSQAEKGEHSSSGRWFLVRSHRAGTKKIEKLLKATEKRSIHRASI